MFICLSMLESCAVRMHVYDVYTAGAFVCSKCGGDGSGGGSGSGAPSAAGAGVPSRAPQPANAKEKKKKKKAAPPADAQPGPPPEAVEQAKDNTRAAGPSSEARSPGGSKQQQQPQPPPPTVGASVTSAGGKATANPRWKEQAQASAAKDGASHAQDAPHVGGSGDGCASARGAASSVDSGPVSAASSGHVSTAAGRSRVAGGAVTAPRPRALAAASEEGKGGAAREAARGAVQASLSPRAACGDGSLAQDGNHVADGRAGGRGGMEGGAQGRGDAAIKGWLGAIEDRVSKGAADKEEDAAGISQGAALVMKVSEFAAARQMRPAVAPADATRPGTGNAAYAGVKGHSRVRAPPPPLVGPDAGSWRKNKAEGVSSYDRAVAGLAAANASVAGSRAAHAEEDESADEGGEEEEEEEVESEAASDDAEGVDDAQEAAEALELHKSLRWQLGMLVNEDKKTADKLTTAVDTFKAVVTGQAPRAVMGRGRRPPPPPVGGGQWE